MSNSSYSDDDACLGAGYLGSLSPEQLARTLRPPEKRTPDIPGSDVSHDEAARSVGSTALQLPQDNHTVYL